MEEGVEEGVEEGRMKREKAAAGLLQTWSALDRVIAAYFRERRARVDGFARERFCLGGMLRAQADTLAGDLVRHPLNAIWSIPCLAIRNAGAWLDKLGLESAGGLVERLPAGIRTCSQKRTEAAVIDELLGLPAHALLTEAAKEPELRELCASPEGCDLLTFQGVEVRKELSAYGSSRMAIYDLAGLLGALAGGYFFFGNGFMSPFEMSHHVARRLSHRHVVTHFFFRNGLGSILFDVFPADPRVAQLVAGSVIVFLALAAFSLVAGIIADPIQAALGTHQRKLNRLLDHLERELRLQMMGFIQARATGGLERKGRTDPLDSASAATLPRPLPDRSPEPLPRSSPQTPA